MCGVTFDSVNACLFVHCRADGHGISTNMRGVVAPAAIGNIIDRIREIFKQMISVQTAENKSVSEYTVEKTTMAHHELFQHSGPKELGLVLHSLGATENADDDINAPTASLTMNVVAEHASATVLQSNDQQQQDNGSVTNNLESDDRDLPFSEASGKLDDTVLSDTVQSTSLHQYVVLNDLSSVKRL